MKAVEGRNTATGSVPQRLVSQMRGTMGGDELNGGQSAGLEIDSPGIPEVERVPANPLISVIACRHCK